MPSADYSIRQNDHGQTITATLLDSNGDPVSLAAATVKFQLAPVGGGAFVVDADAEILEVGASQIGEVEYTWSEGDPEADPVVPPDTATAGWFAASWQVTFTGGSVQTYPNDGYTLIEITPDLPLADADPFATSSELADRLGLTFSTAEHARATKLLTIASGQIRDEVGQTITLVEGDAVTVPGVSGPRLRLKERPVVSVASVSLDGEALTEGVDFYVDGDELVRGVASSERHFGMYAAWGGPSAAVVVTYTHGFASTPDIVKGVCLEMGVRAWTNPGSVSQEGYGVEQVSYPNPGSGLLMTEAEKRTVREAIGRTSGTVTLR